jgi:hypothetical protein
VDELIEAVEYWMSDIVEELEKPKWKQDAEKKSNPADYNNSDEAENNDSKILGIQLPSNAKFVPVEKPKNVNKKNVDIDALRKIASGEGLKGEFQLTKKKIDIDQEYEFTIGSLPDVDDRVFIDKKSIAMIDKYNPGLFFVKWENRNLIFSDKEEFDRFANDNGIILI